MSIQDLKIGQKVFITDQLPHKDANIESWFIVQSINEHEGEEGNIILRPLRDDETAPGWLVTEKERKSQHND